MFGSTTKALTPTDYKVKKGTRVERERGSNAVLAVHNDQIQLPINIQNRRNKQTYDTYAFTIDNFPHVLET
jgi:hypothetical protein